MTGLFELYGTEQPPVDRRFYTMGDLTFAFEDGAVRHMTIAGTEAIRSIAFLVRDRDWGTLVPQISDQQVTQTDAELRISYRARYASQGAHLDVEIALRATETGLCVSATGHASGAFETNRAGFTVLHPICGVAGQAVQVDHSDGSKTDAQFPALIAPWQPFKDISSLTHQAGASRVRCAFRGDTFEMEDQRQWGDASFKTYNRPLAMPWPYAIADGAQIVQAVDVSWQTVVPVPKPAAAPVLRRATFPQMALVITPQDALRLAAAPQDVTVVNPQRLLCHLDATLGATATQFASFAKAQQACIGLAFDLELICRADGDPLSELAAMAAEMAATGFTPDSILVCPSVDRQSTPPGSDWPDCPPLAQVHDAAAKAFPSYPRGGGMVSFFPELNRKRPPVEMLDFVSHGLCPIVHAADDLSVMETLEAVPHITRSARAIIGDRPYRIGPATIAMRQNPYGARTIPNPQGQRVCMADDDPRHRAAFGAAYVVGLAAVLGPAGVSVWTPAALYGPRGVIAEKGDWPITEALGTLADLAGRTVHQADIQGGIARIRVGRAEVSANVTAQTKGDLGPFAWRVASRL